MSFITVSLSVWFLLGAHLTFGQPNEVSTAATTTNSASSSMCGGRLCTENEICKLSTDIKADECVCKDGYRRGAANQCERSSNTVTASTPEKQQDAIPFQIEGPTTVHLPKNTFNLTIVLTAQSQSVPPNYTYYWEVLEGGGYGTANTYTEAEIILSGLKEGVMRLRATVSNDTAKSYQDVSVTVLSEDKPNKPPVAVIRPSSPIHAVEGSRVVIDAEGSLDEEDSRLLFEWKLLQGPAFSLPAMNTAILRLDDLKPGNYSFGGCWVIETRLYNGGTQALYTFRTIHRLNVLDDEQEKAVRLINQGKPPGAIIRAAFGSGKSITAAALADKESPTLLTAMTHAAVDRLAEVITQVVSATVRPLRLYTTNTQPAYEDLPSISTEKLYETMVEWYPNAFGPQEKAYVAKYLEDQTAYRAFRFQANTSDIRAVRREHAKFNALRKRCETRDRIMLDHLIRAYRPNVFLATISCAILETMDERTLENVPVDRVVLDEASQVPESVFWAFMPRFPMAQIILIGDDRQLPPFSTDVDGTAARIGGGSILKRAQQTGRWPIQELRTVYRMHGRMLPLASSLFYNDALRSGVDDEDRRMVLDRLNMPNPDVPVALINNVRGVQCIDLGTSLRNDEEADIIKRLVDQLWAKGIQQDQVMVVAFYKAQQIALDQRLAPMGIKTHTVDSVQGNERDVVILATTRSAAVRDRNYTPFIAVPTRLNVALTRARQGLFIVGNASVLYELPNWRDVIDWTMREEAVTLPGWNF